MTLLTRFDKYVPSASEAAYAQDFRDWDIVHHKAKIAGVYVEMEEVGEWGETWVKIGQLKAYPDKRRFAIHLRRGANWEDLRHIYGAIDLIRAGSWGAIPWDTNTSQRDGTYYYTTLLRPSSNRARDRRDEPVYPCAEKRCAEYQSVHLVARDLGQTEDDIEHHSMDQLRGPDDRWLISLTRREDGPWEVSVETSDILTPSLVASLVNDLQWMRREAETLNAEGRADTVHGRGNA